MGEPKFMWRREHLERALEGRRASVVSNCAGGDNVLKVEMQRLGLGLGSAANTDAEKTHELERGQERGQAGGPEKQAQTQRAVQKSVRKPASPTTSSDLPQSGHVKCGMANLDADYGSASLHADYGSSNQHNISILDQATDYTCAPRQLAAQSRARDASANGTADFMLASEDHQQASEQQPVDLGQELASSDADAVQQDAEALQCSLAAALQACKGLLSGGAAERHPSPATSEGAFMKAGLWRQATGQRSNNLTLLQEAATCQRVQSLESPTALQSSKRPDSRPVPTRLGAGETGCRGGTL